ncbi:MAG: glycosyltransferase [Patescibacteria group bacterium]
MRILVVTQEIDKESPTLGFFHEWVRILAPHYERVEVICLKEGVHDLPQNVRIHSLGKEKGRVSPLLYAIRFKLLAWKLRHEYDAVFVHMNQEYILVAGPLWKLLGKRVYLWRNHYAGSILTDIAAAFCANVFCTSTHSYTAKYKKTKLMPVGVELARFHEAAALSKKANSLLFLARIAPSKRPEMFIEALGILRVHGVPFSARIVGTALPHDAAYYESLTQQAARLGISDSVEFVSGVPHAQTAEFFGTSLITVNCSRSGMFDKTLFEAAAAGSLVLAISDDFARSVNTDSSFTDSASLATRIESLFSMTPEQMHEQRELLEKAAHYNSLESLAGALSAAIL